MKEKWENEMNMMILKHLHFTTSFKSDEYYQRKFYEMKTWILSYKERKMIKRIIENPFTHEQTYEKFYMILFG